ncbi:MAG: hypothetical protein ABJM36_12795 [Algibacter sp.]|uniref:hypothetical protein n=1 Tax=Algibacter sp. TaxID=1872428 RepID=UPI003296B20F
MDFPFYFKHDLYFVLETKGKTKEDQQTNIALFLLNLSNNFEKPILNRNIAIN